VPKTLDENDFPKLDLYIKDELKERNYQQFGKQMRK
jgi:hypothetical protein